MVVVLQLVFLYLNTFLVRLNGIKLAKVELDCLSLYHQL